MRFRKKMAKKSKYNMFDSIIYTFHSFIFTVKISFKKKKEKDNSYARILDYYYYTYT